MKLPDTIDVRWITNKQPADMCHKQSFGYVFLKQFNWERTRRWPFFKAQDWREYVRRAAEETGSNIVSVWVNDEMVWEPQTGWKVDFATFIPQSK